MPNKVINRKGYAYQINIKLYLKNKKKAFAIPIIKNELKLLYLENNKKVFEQGKVQLIMMISIYLKKYIKQHNKVLITYFKIHFLF